jgi:hypothetical protein
MRTTLNILVVLLLTSCVAAVTSSYTPPTTHSYSNSITFDNSKDEVWKALVNSASSSFFAIKNFEKDSGLMTLDFGASKIEDFVDCGTWTGGGFNNANYIVRNKAVGNNMSLNGVMNLLVLESSENKTTLRVNARYILSMTGSRMQYNYLTGSSYAIPTHNAWSFDSGGSDAIAVGNAAPGTIATRTCSPTGLAETQIVESVKKALL